MMRQELLLRTKLLCKDLHEALIALNDSEIAELSKNSEEFKQLLNLTAFTALKQRKFNRNSNEPKSFIEGEFSAEL